MEYPLLSFAVGMNGVCMDISCVNFVKKGRTPGGFILPVIPFLWSITLSVYNYHKIQFVTLIAQR
jgi:hypothetical protein